MDAPWLFVLSPPCALRKAVVATSACGRLRRARPPRRSPLHVLPRLRCQSDGVDSRTSVSVDPDRRLKVEAHELFMPALSSTMSEGKIVQWLKEVGDPIRPGEPVMVVESDKADMDVEAFEEGYLAQVLVESGGTAPVGATVGLVAKRKEDIEAVRSCGLECVVDGSGSRHDGTTAYPDNMPKRTMTTAAPEGETVVAASPAPSPPSTTPQSPTPVAPFAPSGTPPTKPPGVMEVFMPALSSTMTEGKIVQWLREVGEHVTKGAPVMIVESDKADMDVESFEEGYLAYVATPNGGMQAVGEAVGYLAATKADIPAVQAWAQAVHEGGGATVKAPAAAEQAAPPPPSPPSPPEPRMPETAPPPPSSSGRIIASPYAKKLARERGLDLHGVKGSGPNGRIIAEDVEREARRRAVEQAAAPPTRSIATPEAKKLAKARGVALDNVRGTGPYGRITGDDVRRALGEPMEHEEPEKKSEKCADRLGADDRHAESGDEQYERVVVGPGVSRIVSHRHRCAGRAACASETERHECVGAAGQGGRADAEETPDHECALRAARLDLLPRAHQRGGGGGTTRRWSDHSGAARRRRHRRARAEPAVEESGAGSAGEETQTGRVPVGHVRHQQHGHVRRQRLRCHPAQWHRRHHGGRRQPARSGGAAERVYRRVAGDAGDRDQRPPTHLRRAGGRVLARPGRPAAEPCGGIAVLGGETGFVQRTLRYSLPALARSLARSSTRSV
eukprot:ctg_1206.g421